MDNPRDEILEVLRRFVIRASSENAQIIEIEKLPEVARLLFEELRMSKYE